MNINFSLGNIGNLNRLAEDYTRRNATVTPAPVAPRPAPVAAPVAPTPTPVEYSSLNNRFLDYRDSLSGGANYASINDVDKVDDYYDNLFNEAFTVTPFFNTEFDSGGEGGAYSSGTVAGSGRPSLSYSEYASITDNTPAYLQDFGRASATVDKTVQAYSAVKDLSSTGELAAALSSYYGYDIAATGQSFSKSDFGGNLGQHTSSSDAELKQFHSLVEPILKDQVTYLQATQNLSYQDALMTAYQSDPMLQALYHKYDVKPVRQTSDGSSYLYDPFSFGEIRTFESKDPGFMDIASNIMVATIVGKFLGVPAEALVAKAGISGAAASTAATMGASAATAQLLGGDPITAALFAGIPIGDIPIPLTGKIRDLLNSGGGVTQSGATNITLSELTGGNIDFFVGGSPLAIAMQQGLAGSTAGGLSTGVGSTGVGPDFNPYINNIAASVAGTTVEAEEEQYNIDLANLAALSQPEEAPVTPVTPPPLAPEPVAVPVEPIEQPELPLDIAPPVLPTDSTDGGGSTADTAPETSPYSSEEEEEKPFFQILERYADGSVLVVDKYGEEKVYTEDYFREGLLHGETYSEDIPPEDNIFPTYDIPTDSSSSTDGVATDSSSSTDGVAADGTVTGNNVTGDSGSGGGSGGGDGNGTGGGAGGGLGAGMLGGAAAGGKPSVTDLVFSDYVKRYEAPELQERALPLQGYQAPQGLFRGLV